MSRIPITRPDLGDAEVEAVTRVIRSGWVTQGPEVAALEREFAEAVGAPTAVAVSNCSAALELSLRVLGIGPGDDVITVSHTFIATPNAVRNVGARPVFVDVEPDTLGMQPQQLEAAFTPHTKAILAVHQLGIPCDISAILAFADRRGVPVIEDAACAIGSELLWKDKWRRIGLPFGVIACFSFHPRKVITTGDGGMITTADPTLERGLRRLRQHGMSIPDTVRHDANTVIFEEYVEPGYNCRLTDVQAALARPQLRRLDSIVSRRRQLADCLSRALSFSRVLAPPQPRPGSRWNWQSYPASLRPAFEGRQVEVLQYLLCHGVACKRGVSNAHQEPAYANRGGWLVAANGLTVSERLRDSTVMLPLFQSMTNSEMEALISALASLDRDFGGASP